MACEKAQGREAVVAKSTKTSKDTGSRLSPG
jgi:hypothetical protein